MIKLEIISKNNYLYTLKTEFGQEYLLNLEFLDIIENPNVGDYMWVAEDLLNPQYEGFSTSYTFGGLENVYGKKEISLDDIDVIQVVVNEEEIYLKRLYG